MKPINSIAIVACFIWIGFVGAISFMEAWLKFKAPGVTLPIGLGIGRLVFSALNKMEWLFFLLILINLVLKNIKILEIRNITLLIVFIILLAQTFWLLPVLDARAELHIQGQISGTSNTHFYYIALEIIKTITLFILGYFLIKEKI